MSVPIILCAGFGFIFLAIGVCIAAMVIRLTIKIWKD